MFLAFLIFASSLSPKAEASVPQPREVQIAWEYKNFPGKIELYEVTPKYRYAISTTGTTSSLERAPVTGKKISDQLRILPGESKTFVLVVRNPSPDRWFFFASPHLMDPPEASQGHHFECLCIHHIFEVPPKKLWYRIVRLNLSPDFSASQAKLVHTVIGVPESEALTTHKKELFFKPKKGGKS